MSQPPKRRLGRGLSALIPQDDPSPAPASGATPTTGLLEVRVDQVAAVTQPRTQFDEQALQELADSIRTHGILQPILVRHESAYARDRYVIIAGERRFRAAQRAGLDRVPVLIREATEAEAYALALIENVQRADLDPIEEAHAYQHLAQTAGLTQEQMAQQVGKSRVSVTNALRLLKLPAPVQALVVTGELSAGHARAILQAPEDERIDLAHRAAAERWSVRDTERAARAQANQPDPEPAAPAGPEPAEPSQSEGRSPDDVALEDRLRTVLGAPLSLKRTGDKGRLEVRFHSRAELDRLVDLLLSLEQIVP